MQEPPRAEGAPGIAHLRERLARLGTVGTCLREAEQELRLHRAQQREDHCREHDADGHRRQKEREKRIESPADIDPESAESTLNQLASDLRNGKRADPTELRDRLLHTVACKAAIKGGQHSDDKERAALVREVMTRKDLKYCPHGRPICTVLTAAQLERQFKRT